MVDQTDKNGTWSKERKKINRTAIISVVLAAIIVTTFFAGYFVRGITEPVLGEIWGIIQGTSVYTKDMTEDELAELFVKATLKDDKYAKYYSPKEYAKIREEDKGRYSGVGIGITEDNNTGDVKVAKVYINSSAYKKNVKAGDILVGGIKKGETEYTDFKVAVSEYNQDKEEDEKITVLSVVNDFFADFIIGDEIKLKIKQGSAEPEEKTLNKEKYNVSYVEYKDEEEHYYFSTETSGIERLNPIEVNVLPCLDTDTAYIKLYEFEGDAAAQFNKALEYMRTRGKTKLILDLRDNGGGLVDILLNIASYLINYNDAADIRVLNFKDKISDSHYSTNKNRFYKGENQLTDISVIANAGTASASECLIGALSDYGNREAFNGASFSIEERLILTERNDTRGYFCTYGKGIMQTTYSLKSGGALQLTTAQIFWPISWTCVQDVGIQTVPENCVSDEDAIARANEVLHPLP